MPDPAAFRLSVTEGDLTKIEADAIVNAANSVLLAGGGVCGAIYKAAGVDEVITPAFGIMTAKCIIHAVGPVYSKYDPAEARRLLAAAYAASIRLAADHGCASIAFPSIRTGRYGYPLGGGLSHGGRGVPEGQSSSGPRHQARRLRHHGCAVPAQAGRTDCVTFLRAAPINRLTITGRGAER